MPRKIRKCAKKHGFNPDNLPEPEKCEIENPVPTPPWWLLPVRVVGTVGAVVLGI